MAARYRNRTSSNMETGSGGKLTCSLLEVANAHVHGGDAAAQRLGA